MNKEEFLQSGLLEQYVLGLTSPEENEEVERYAEAFPEIRKEIEGMRRAMEEYASQYAVPPPAHLKEKIIREIEEEGGDVGKSRTDREAVPGAGARRSGSWAVMFSLLALALLGWLAFNNYQRAERMEDRYVSLSARFDQFRTECEEQKEDLKDAARLFAFLRHGATRQVRLRGTDLAPGAETLVYLNDQESLAYLNVVNLPEPPDGHTYQLWADVEGEMINMGVINAHSSNLQAVTFIDRAESLNLTIEPAGGSEHPTVERLVVNGKV